jgi:shikimate dehydrogenase
MTDRYAVIGNPIAHSKSPLIHAAFARATGEDVAYEALLAPLDAFAATVRAFFAAGGRGANVTVPFKQQAYALADEATDGAHKALAANVLEMRNGRIVAHNTDGIGLLRDLTRNLGCAVCGRRVLLMGAGGASWGVAGPLLQAGPSRFTVVNRTADKAVALVRHFAQAGGDCTPEALTYAELGGQSFDVIINATSAGLTGAMPPLPESVFAAESYAYDMVYGKATPFMRYAREHGARVADGTGMLVEQAAESFYIWRGVRPETAPVIAMLRGKGVMGEQ